MSSSGLFDRLCDYCRRRSWPAKAVGFLSRVVRTALGCTEVSDWIFVKLQDDDDALHSELIRLLLAGDAHRPVEPRFLSVSRLRDALRWRRLCVGETWQRFEGTRSVLDFLDPASVPFVRRSTDHFFRCPPGDLAGKRFTTSLSCLAVGGPSRLPCLQQYVRVRVARHTAAQLLEVVPPADAEEEEELRAVCSVAAWLAMGRHLPPRRQASETHYPDVFGAYRSCLRIPETASPLDLLLVLRRVLGAARVALLLRVAVAWLVCDTGRHDLSSVAATRVTGLLHPTIPGSDARGVLFQCHRERDRELWCLSPPAEDLLATRFFVMSWTPEECHSSTALETNLQPERPLFLEAQKGTSCWPVGCWTPVRF